MQITMLVNPPFFTASRGVCTNSNLRSGKKTIGHSILYPGTKLPAVETKLRQKSLSLLSIKQRCTQSKDLSKRRKPRMTLYALMRILVFFVNHLQEAGDRTLKPS